MRETESHSADDLAADIAERLSAYWAQVRAADPSMPAIDFIPFDSLIACARCEGEAGHDCPLCLGRGFFVD